MKKTFYVYWVWYIAITLFLISGVKLPLEWARFLTCLQHLSQILVVVIPMSTLLIMQEKLSKVNWKYFEGCMISFILRGVSYMMGVYDVLDRTVMLALSGLILILWYLFNRKSLVDDY